MVKIGLTETYWTLPVEGPKNLSSTNAMCLIWNFKEVFDFRETQKRGPQGNGIHNSAGSKGQLISKCLFGVIASTKISTKKFDNFCPRIWKVVKS